MPIASLADVKQYLGISDTASDTPLQVALEVAEQWAKDVTGQKFAGANVTYTETFIQRHAGLVKVANPPIASVTSVKAGTLLTEPADLLTLDAEQWVLHDAARGLIYVSPTWETGAWDPRQRDWLSHSEKLQVVYVGGADAPVRVKHAVVMVAAWLFQTPEYVAGGIRSGSALGMSNDFMRSVPPEAVDLIRPHMRRPWVRFL